MALHVARQDAVPADGVSRKDRGQLREPDVEMRREGLAERKSRASPLEAAGLLRVPRRAALRVSPLRGGDP
jgi:hypothetical protein